MEMHIVLKDVLIIIFFSFDNVIRGNSEVYKKRFEDAEGVIWSHIQCNDQNKKVNDLQNMVQKIRDWSTQSQQKLGVTSGAYEG